MSVAFIRASGELLQEYKGHTCKVSLQYLDTAKDLLLMDTDIDHKA